MLVLGVGASLVSVLPWSATQARPPKGYYRCGETALVEVWSSLPCPEQHVAVVSGADVVMIPKLAEVKRKLLTPP